MNYKLLRTDDFTGKKIYEKIDDNGKSYLSCSEDNEEFKLFQSYKEDDFLRFEFIYYIGD